MLIGKKRPARRKISYSPNSGRTQYLETVKSVPKLFDELFNDYRHNPNLFAATKLGLEKGWIKQEYINKKFDNILNKIEDGENLPFYTEFLEKAVEEKIVTRKYTKKYFHKRVELRRECNNTLYALTSGDDTDKNMGALERGLKLKLVDPFDVELAKIVGMINRDARLKQDYKVT